MSLVTRVKCALVFGFAKFFGATDMTFTGRLQVAVVGNATIKADGMKGTYAIRVAKLDGSTFAIIGSGDMSRAREVAEQFQRRDELAWVAQSSTGDLEQKLEHLNMVRKAMVNPAVLKEIEDFRDMIRDELTARNGGLLRMRRAI